MKKLVEWVVICCIAISVLAGCGSEQVNNGGTLDFKGYPIKNDETLTYWQGLSSAISTVVDNAAKTEFAKYLKDQTGVNIEFLHPVAGQEETSLSLLLASNQLPDMIEASWNAYNGGPIKNIKEKVILPLNDVIDKDAPNLKKYLDDNKEIAKSLKTSNGDYYVFPFIRGDKRLLISVGGLIRRDWLKDVGMQIPKTVDDLEKALTAFKDKKGAIAPMCITASNMNTFLGNFSTSNGFYLEKGKVVFGPLTENYKIAAETLHRWYTNGLLDPNFISIDSAGLDSNVLTGKTGYTISSGGGSLGTWLDNMNKSNQQFDMVGMPFTDISTDNPNTYYNTETEYPGYGSVAITTACKNVPLAARFLDYGYSNEGKILYNYGKEGVSFKLVDGKYTYTDEIFKNPDGLTISQAMQKYFRASSAGPFVQEKGYIDQFYYRPNQQDTLNAWLEKFDNVADNKLPKLNLSEEETAEYTEIMTEINKYVSKSLTGFIIGNTELTNYEKFTNELKKLNIDRVLELVNKNYEQLKKM